MPSNRSSLAPTDESGELDEEVEAPGEGLHGFAEALADGHERKEEVAAAGEEAPSTPPTGGTPPCGSSGARTPAPDARAVSDDPDRTNLEFRVLRGFGGGGVRNQAISQFYS